MGGGISLLLIWLHVESRGCGVRHLYEINVHLSKLCSKSYLKKLGTWKTLLNRPSEAVIKNRIIRQSCFWLPFARAVHTDDMWNCSPLLQRQTLIAVLEPVETHAAYAARKGISGFYSSTSSMRTELRTNRGSPEASKPTVTNRGPSENLLNTSFPVLCTTYVQFCPKEQALFREKCGGIVLLDNSMISEDVMSACAIQQMYTSYRQLENFISQA